MTMRDDLTFDLPGGGHVLFTTRAHGNMSSVGGVDHEHGHDNRERVRARLRLRGLLRGHQVHGTTVISIRTTADVPDFAADPGHSPARADGHVIAVAHVGAMALAADCLPVAIGGEGAVAMVHAGWRGLAAGVLEEGVWALRDLVGDRQLKAVIGPGAGACCYEVGPEVHAALAPQADTGRRGTIDLRAIARLRLEAIGVRDVGDVGVCTICDQRFFSHRREGTRAGRQAGIAWLSP